LIIQAA